MTVTYAYQGQDNQIVLSNVCKDQWKLAPLETLRIYLSLNTMMINRPFLCEEGLVSSIHGGTIQYRGRIKKHPEPLWLASKDFRGTIDFYYSQFEWPFQINFQPQGFLGDFVIERLKKGYIVPLLTRQIRQQQPNMSEAHEMYAWESQEQIRERVKGKLDLTAR